MNNLEVQEYTELESYKVWYSFLAILSVATIGFIWYVLTLVYVFFM